MSLEKRRITGDLIETFKILNQIDKVDPSDIFTRAKTALNKNLIVCHQPLE